MILGIDFGSSATDYVLMDRGKIVFSDSLFSNKIEIKEILKKMKRKGSVEKIFVTGGKANKVPKRIGKIPVSVVDEIKAIGGGGCFVSGNKNALVVSIGSGTAMVSVKGKEIKHIGGTPVGAKTLTGLSELILKTNDPVKIEKLAKKGNLEKTDITLKSIYPKGIGLLPPSATASHFGNLKSPNKNDVAKALINLTAQTIGTLAVFGAKACDHKKIILTGKITQSKQFKGVIIDRINNLSNVPVIIPKNSGMATAIGAVAYGLKKK